MPSKRLLYVEDDDNLRTTLAAILQGHGFEVIAVGSVGDALNEISSNRFDFLISDLNLGEAGDGFTVTSAMRRLQPHCRSFILTGYPEFDAALSAIRNQVDDFLLKPADIKMLVNAIRSKIEDPGQRNIALRKPLADFLVDNRGEVIRRVLESMKMHRRLSQLPLSDMERVDHLEGVILGLVTLLQNGHAPEDDSQNIYPASNHGVMRKKQGYSPVMLIDDIRILDGTIYELVSENLLGINLSRLIPDLGRLNQSLEFQLQVSLVAFSANEKEA